jgi:hypothetical protein
MIIRISAELRLPLFPSGAWTLPMLCSFFVAVPGESQSQLLISCVVAEICSADPSSTCASHGRVSRLDLWRHAQALTRGLYSARRTAPQRANCVPWTEQPSAHVQLISPSVPSARRASGPSFHPSVSQGGLPSQRGTSRSSPRGQRRSSS